jgi:pheromone shutdown protein TraB
VKPKAVFVELCEKRKDILHAPDTKELLKKKPDMKEIIKGLRSGEHNAFSLVYAYVLSDVGNELEVLPGEEFRVAYETGNEVNADSILGDRHVNITIKRVWQGLSFMQKVKLVYMLLFSGHEIPEKEEFKAMVEKMKQRGDQMTAAILELGEEFPWLLECLVRERDIYMTYKLQKVNDDWAKLIINWLP